MANYYPYIKPNYVASDGYSPLYVRYNYDQVKRTLIATGYNIKPEHWDSKKKWIKRAYPQFEDIDLVLPRLLLNLVKSSTMQWIMLLILQLIIFCLN